jgi:hypothetical protein
VSHAQFDRECLYQATLAVARTLYQRGLITDEELAVIDTKMREKYRPVLGNLCPINPAK